MRIEHWSSPNDPVIREQMIGLIERSEHINTLLSRRLAQVFIQEAIESGGYVIIKPSAGDTAG